jgi:hypothetical protein
MKKSILLLAILGLLFSCHKNDEELAPTSLAGTWKLTEVLADIGDGKGTFHPISSNKNLVFVSDNKVTSNSQICDFSLEANSSSTASYSQATSTINCSNFVIHYELKADTLILSYPCIEGCQAKYIKVP